MRSGTRSDRSSRSSPWTRRFSCRAPSSPRASSRGRASAASSPKRSRAALEVGMFSAAVAGASGVAIGGVAGYAGGAVDAVLMRGTDAMLAIPRLPLLMIAAVVLQPSIPALIVLIGIAGWMETARVVRAEFRTLGGRGFVESARAAGAGHARVLVRHLLPNAAQAVAVSITLAVARGI